MVEKKTIDDLEFLYNNNRSLYIKLYNWLGSLPIQVKHKFDNVEYNLAHAFFNEKLYKINPNFNLETLNTGQEANLNPSQILWFRKNNDSYDSKVLPNAKSKIIIGHTPLRFREGVDLDLVNQYNEKVPVICVDGGIAYDNKMVKFVAGHSRSIGSVIESYNYVPPKKADSIPERTTPKDQKLGVIKKMVGNVRRAVGELGRDREYQSTGSLEDRINTIILESLMNNYDSMEDFEYELSNCIELYGQSILFSGNITAHGIMK